MQPRLIVMTGAPGTGKTAILNALAPGIGYVREPAREVLAEQRAIGGKGTSEEDASLFVQLLLERSIEKHQDAMRGGRLVLFDRGVPDCVAYAHQLGGDPEPCRKAAAHYRYESTVLVARPWEDIYATDEERKMAFAATLPFQHRIEEAYQEAGYELLEIPRATLPERVDFVARFVAAITSGAPRA